MANFDRFLSAVPEEFHASGGDSGGPWLGVDASDGQLKLLGVTSAVSGPFRHTPTSPVFEAMLLDWGGLYSEAGDLLPNHPFIDLPSSVSATRVSARIDWIESVISPDSDGDGIADDTDNCTLTYNPGQDDTDGDDYGNACDGDFDQNGVVDAKDFHLFLPDFESGLDNGMGTDMSADGTVDANDFDLFVTSFLVTAPGPSALAP